MKLKEKILSAFMMISSLIVFLFSLPMLSVKAEEESVYSPPKYTDISGYGYTLLEMRSYLESNYPLVSRDSLDSSIKFPNLYFSSYNNNNVSKSDCISLNLDYTNDYFAMCLSSILGHTISYLNLDEKIYFYGYFLKSNTDDTMKLYIYYSRDYIFFNTTNPNNIYMESTSKLYNIFTTYTKKSNGNIDVSGFSSSISANKEYEECRSVRSGLHYTQQVRYDLSKHTNYEDIFDGYTVYFINGTNSPNPDFLPNADTSNIITGIKQLKDQIDVKLTPEFGLGMDRTIPNNAFNTSEDYFCIEITNNNSFNIQFSCFVVPGTGNVDLASPASGEEYIKEYANEVPTILNTDGLIPYLYPDQTVWILEKSTWIYSKDTSNQDDYRLGTPYSVYKPTTKFHLKPGETFKQMVKWNQLYLNPKQPYEFVVAACETPYDKATDIGGSLASDNFDINCKHIMAESYFFVCDIKFSVINPLTYDPNDTYAGIIPNTGKQQIQDDYWKMGAIEKDGEINIVNADYLNGWRLDPEYSDHYYIGNNFDFDFDIDDVGINDLKNLIKTSFNFFGLIKAVMLSFPSWIWVLICFGLTGLIIIAIIKALL